MEPQNSLNLSARGSRRRPHPGNQSLAESSNPWPLPWSPEKRPGWNCPWRGMVKERGTRKKEDPWENRLLDLQKKNMTNTCSSPFCCQSSRRSKVMLVLQSLTQKVGLWTASCNIWVLMKEPTLTFEATLHHQPLWHHLQPGDTFREHLKTSVQLLEWIQIPGGPGSCVSYIRGWEKKQTKTE